MTMLRGAYLNRIHFPAPCPGTLKARRKLALEHCRGANCEGPAANLTAKRAFFRPDWSKTSKSDPKVENPLFWHSLWSRKATELTLAKVTIRLGQSHGITVIWAAGAMPPTGSPFPRRFPIKTGAHQRKNGKNCRITLTHPIEFYAILVHLSG